MPFKLTPDSLKKLRNAINVCDEKHIALQLEELHPPDIAEIFNELDLEEAKYLYTLLDEAESGKVLVEMEVNEARNCSRLFSATAYAEIIQSGAAHFFRIVDVPGVEKPGSAHQFLELLQIHLLELVPLRHDYHGIGVFCGLEGVFGVGNLRENFLGVFHRDRVVVDHLGSSGQ